MRCQRLEPFFTCDRGACATFRSVRTIDVFDLGERRRFFERRFNVRRHFVERTDRGSDLFFSFFQTAQIGKAFGKPPQCLIVERPVRFLSVPRDKRDRIALVDQLDRILRLPCLQGKLFAQLLNDVHESLLP